MVRAIHVEDEPGIIGLMKSLLEEHCADTVEYCGNASSEEAALKLIADTDPELIYMDIQLKDSNSFQILEKIRDRDFEIIFLTAYDNFAIKAIKENAADYILKPIDINELISATKKAVARIEKNRHTKGYAEPMLNARISPELKKIALPDQDGIIFINTDDIIHAEAKGAYSVLTLINEKKITVTKNLKELEEILPQREFFRVHHSWIINLKYVKKFYRGKNSYMEMENGSAITVSTRRKSSFLDMFGK